MGFPKTVSTCCFLLSCFMIGQGVWGRSIDPTREDFEMPDCNCTGNATSGNGTNVNVTTPLESATEAWAVNGTEPTNSTTEIPEGNKTKLSANSTKSTRDSTTEASHGNNTEPTTNSTPELSHGNNTEPTTNSTSELSHGNNTEPPTNSTSELSHGNNTEPTTNSTSELSLGNNTEPTTESTSESSLGNNTEPTTDSTTELSLGNNTEPTIDSITELSLGNSTELTTDSTSESSLGNNTEPATESTTESSAGSATVYEMCVDNTIDPTLGQFTLTSHQFRRGGYGRFERCRTRFSPDVPRVLRMTFDTFHVEAGRRHRQACRKDKLIVNYAILCGSWPSGRTLDFLAKPNTPFIFKFLSDYSVATEGFSIQVDVLEYKPGQIIREYNGVGNYPLRTFYEASCGRECYTRS